MKFTAQQIYSITYPLTMQIVGLYQTSAPTKNRTFLQIQFWPKCSRISLFGQICKIAHTNTAMFSILN